MKSWARHLVREILIEHLFQFRNRTRRWLTDLFFNKKRPSKIKDQKTGNILFIRLDGKYGDSIISQYLYKKLKSELNSELYMLSKNKKSIEFFQHNIDHFIICNKPRRALHLYRAYKQLRKINFDYVIYLGKETKDRELILLRYINTFCFISGDRRIKFTDHFLILTNEAIHYKQRCNNVLISLGITPENTEAPSLIIPTKEINRVKSEINIPSKFIYLNPYGAGSQRKFTEKNIHKIESIIREHLPEYCVITQSYKHHPLSISTKSRNIYLFTTKSFNEILILISLSEFVITVDTATSHAATELGKRSIVFYNSDPVNYTEWNANSTDSMPIFSKKPEKQKLPNINNIDFKDLISALKSNKRIS